MSIKKQAHTRGIILTPDDIGLDGVEGELKVGATSKKVHAYLDGSVRNVVTENQTATLTNKSIDADNNPISNLEVDNLKAGVLDTDLSSVSASDDTIPSAKATKAYVDSVATSTAATAQTALDNHINDTADAHDASAISNVASGNLAATDVQGALNELQTDIDTRATQTALTDHISDATDAHAASAITNTPSGNLAATTVQGALNELQTDIDTRVTGPASATDNAVARFDLTTGKLIQNSAVTISDAGSVAGVNGLSAGGNINLTGPVSLDNITSFAQNVDTTTTGSNATVPSSGYSYTKLTNSSLVSIDLIGSPSSNSRILVIENGTGNSITINNDTGATAAQRILTGTKADLVLTDEATLILIYDIDESRWTVIGGTGATSSNNLNTVTRTTSYTPPLSVDLILCNTTSAGFTVTLPTASGNTGKVFTIENTGTAGNTLTVDTTSSQTINGALTFLMDTQYDSVKVVSDGSNWLVLGTTKSITVRATHTAGTSLPSGATTKIPLASGGIRKNITLDTTNHRITVIEPGIYKVSAGLRFATTTYTNPTRLQLRLHKNGSLAAILQYYIITNTANHVESLYGSLDQISMATNDYLELFVEHSNSGAISVDATGSVLNYFNVTMRDV